VSAEGTRPAGSRQGSGFQGFAWIVLAVNLGVILWGAFVRASGSGAGCGSHWPLCNGAIVPQDPSQATVIEFVHRFGSALALALVVALWIWSERRFARGGAARRWARVATALIVLEAIVGAGLVLNRWVGDDASAARAVTIAVHLVLTYALLASLTLVMWSGSPRPRSAIPPSIPVSIAVGLVAGMALLGVSGALTALGDTLFPPGSLAQGVAQDISPGGNMLLRIRLVHPLLALIVVGGGVVWADKRRRSVDNTPATWRLTLLRGILLVQLAAGAANVLLLAPVWLQILHLFLADVVWILLILCLAEAPVGKTEFASVSVTA